MDTESKDGKDGSCCGRKSCCGGKALAAIALLAVGAAGGYLCARGCGDKPSAAVSATAPKS